MNILLVTMEMNMGGAETHVLELAKALKNRKHNVFVISAGGKLVDELEKSGVKHIYAPLKDKKINHIITSMKTIKKAIKINNIDVVHAHARIPGAICGVVCKKTKTHFVTTVHGIYRLNFLLKKLTNWGEKTLAVSQDIKNQVIKDYGLKEENVFVTVNGIDLSTYKKSKTPVISGIKLDENKDKIVHVSRIDNDTREVVTALVEISDKLDKETKNGVQLIIIGGGNYFEELKEKTEKMQNVVLIKGPRTDINQLLNLGDLFVGASRCALEAMATELPVILAGNSANGQGYLGIFSEANLQTAINTNFTCRGMPKIEKEQLKKDIIKLLETKTPEMGEYNRNIIEKMYSVDKMVEDALKIYQ